MRLCPALAFLALGVFTPQSAMAQVVAVADSGDTAWTLVCAILLMLAALPGLALRNAGLVNVRSALALAIQAAGIVAIASLVWAVAGYSLAYSPGNAWLGGGGNVMLGNMASLREGLTIPEAAFALFQMALALFAAGLLAGSVGERARLGWMMVFAPLWLLLVYAPVVRWTWGGGWLAGMGVMDFAGGLVVHLTAGFSALVLCLLAGRRKEATSGHAPMLALAGSSLVWIGWFGAIGGWSLGATDDAATALLNAHLAASAAALLAALLDRLLSGHVRGATVIGGALAGLAAISSGAALVGTGGAIGIGLLAALFHRLALAVSRGIGLDDPSQVFAIHGVGGLTGMIALPAFILPLLGGVGFEAGATVTGQFVAQGIGVAVVALWAAIGSAIVALALSIVMPLRASAAVEAEGLDTALHDEPAWDFR